MWVIKMDIFINNDQDKMELPDGIEELVQNIAVLSLKEEKIDTDYEISVTFVDNDRIRELNRNFRDKDSETDVLSFPMGEEDEIEVEGVKPMLGDIVISLEKADEQAKELGHSLYREIAYLTVHSMFHLLGYDHMNDEEKSEMREKEKKIIREIKVFRNEQSN